jgi:hypothetical protein
LLLAAFLSACTTRQRVTLIENPTEVTLGQARGRLEDANQPVQRTRTYIQISGVLLSFVRKEILRQDPDKMKDRLEEYRMAILSAGQTMSTSGRDGELHPEGYRDLELVLRQHLRLLGDLRRHLLDEERKPIDEAMETATSVRQEMLRSLFPMYTPRIVTPGETP